MNLSLRQFAGWSLIICPILIHVFFGTYYGFGDNENASAFLTEATNNMFLSRILLTAGNVSMLFIAIAIILISHSYASDSKNPLFARITGILFLAFIAGMHSLDLELRALNYFNENKVDEALTAWSLTQGSSGAFNLILGLGLIFFGRAIRETKSKIQPNILLNIISFGMLIFGIIQIINILEIKELEILGFLGWFGTWISVMIFGISLIRNYSASAKK